MFRSITDSIEDCQSGEDYQSGKWFKWQVASGDWLQVRQVVTKRREGVGFDERGLRSAIMVGKIRQETGREIKCSMVG